MEFLKRAAVGSIILGLLPFAMGNKGCQDANNWEHPPVARSADCQECHEEGMAVNKKPQWHTAGFGRDHGQQMARFGFKSTNNCMVCHDQATCNSCHQQEQPRDHNQFFRLKGHGLQVGLDRSRCQTCHQTDYCQRCHASTQPLDHVGGFGGPSNRHCLSCHFPIDSAGAQRCATCHSSTPSHTAGTPAMPSNSLHVPGADCRGCHVTLRHPDNGMNCTSCHMK